MAETKKGAELRRHMRRNMSGFTLVAYKTQAASAYRPRRNIGDGVLDISAGGLRLRLTESVFKGDSITIEIKELTTGDVFHARGDVRWTETKETDGKKQFFCGIQFVEIFTPIAKREKFFLGQTAVLAAKPATPTQMAQRPTGTTLTGATAAAAAPAAPSAADGRKAERFQVDDYTLTVFRTGLLSSVGIRKNLATEVVDLSRSGAQIVCVEKLPMGGKISFTLHLNKFADTFESEAEVVWIKEGPSPDGIVYFTGVTFTSISPEKRKLIDYMMSWFTSYQAKYKSQR
jgi:c-di-GMP-binding flagellar brake protein YcgR